MAKNQPQNRRLGYARVSTYGQTLDAQLEQLRGAGCTKIYREKLTGAYNDRRELLKLLKAVAPGDVVTVTRIDRLARSTFDLFAIVLRRRRIARACPSARVYPFATGPARGKGLAFARAGRAYVGDQRDRACLCETCAARNCCVCLPP